MASVLLAIDIILAIGLTILVLLQRSEGGALGALGGGSGNSMFTGRQTGNMLTRLTWWFFALFVIVNIALVIIAKKSTVEEPVSLIPTEQTAPALPQNGQPVPASNTTPSARTNALPVVNDSVRLAMADKAPVIEYEAPTATSEAQIDIKEQKPSMEVQIEAPALPEVPTVPGGDPVIDAGAFPADE